MDTVTHTPITVADLDAAAFGTEVILGDLLFVRTERGIWEEDALGVMMASRTLVETAQAGPHELRLAS